VTGKHLLAESVRNMTRRSIPSPHPPVGGKPCSRLAHVRLDKAFRILISNKCNSRIQESLIHALCLLVSLLLLPCLHNTSCAQNRKEHVRRKLTCSSKRSRWSNGSFNSVYALQNSFVHMNPSNRSQRPARERCRFAKGDMT
jgi:hypothetical protein